jgi:LacI family transcriptional regulator
MKHINIKELAKMLSLNPSTISRALSDHPDIKEKTKEKVKAAALEFNYQPNLHARYFRQKTSGLIAVILPEFNMFFHPELMRGISQVVEASGRSIIIFFSNDNFEKEREIINHCLSWAVDGVLISVSQNTKNWDHFMTLKSAGIPIVLMDKVILNDNFTTITIDDEKAAYDATSLLLGSGKTSLLGVFGNPELQITKSRLTGFQSAMKGDNIRSECKFIYAKDEILVEQLKKFILNNQFDGVFAMSDEVLLIVHSILHQYNLFPNQVLLSAISDGILPKQLFPTFAFVKHSGYELGAQAALTLLSLKESKIGIQHIQIKTELIKPL